MRVTIGAISSAELREATLVVDARQGATRRDGGQVGVPMASIESDPLERLLRKS